MKTEVNAHKLLEYYFFPLQLNVRLYLFPGKFIPMNTRILTGTDTENQKMHKIG